MMGHRGCAAGCGLSDLLDVSLFLSHQRGAVFCLKVVPSPSVLRSGNDQKHLEPFWGCSKGDIAFQWCFPPDDLRLGLAEGETEAQDGCDLAEVSGEDPGICGSPM